jgi:predicted protein tyrosine phosphatase
MASLLSITSLLLVVDVVVDLNFQLTSQVVAAAVVVFVMELSQLHRQRIQSWSVLAKLPDARKGVEEIRP